MELSIIMGRGKDIDGGVWYHGFVVPTPADGALSSADALWATPDCKNEQMVYDACAAYIKGQGQSLPSRVRREYEGLVA